MTGRNFLRHFSRLFHRRMYGAAFTIAGSTAFAYGLKCLHDQNIFPSPAAFPLIISCETKVFPQSSVINGTKNHALFLTIHLTPEASPQECLKIVGHIQKHVDAISPPSLRDENDEIWFGVGFSSKFMEQLKTDDLAKVQPFPYRARSGPLGDLPSTGGDIFIHAKCHERGKLFQLCQAIMNNMPQSSVANFEDVYGWVYRGGRDLSGFIDGTANPADEDDRIAAAIDPQTGGSYVVTQKWIHKHDVIKSTKDHIKEQWIGRELEDSTELKNKPITSHVARMVGSADFDAPSKYQIVRHSQPWGTVSGDSGLFFIAYSATPVALDWMLDRMTGDGADKHADDVMRLTRCVTGNFWYFPSQPEFDRLVSNNTGGGGGFRLWR